MAKPTDEVDKPEVREAALRRERDALAVKMYPTPAGAETQRRRLVEIDAALGDKPKTGQRENAVSK